jgi:aspartyl-tRNA(Asn)/glutamyl-tRNA(Gln) amidotransferase subunit A
VQPAIRAAYDKALALIGIPVEALDLPDPTAIRLGALAGIARALIADLGDMRSARRLEISPELHFLMDALEAMPEQPALLAELKAILLEALGDDGVMLLPATPQVAFPHGSAPPHSQADFTALASIAGLPALSLPVGTNAEDLPVGLQLIGPPGSEVALINLARTLAPALGGSIATAEEVS